MKLKKESSEKYKENIYGRVREVKEGKNKKNINKRIKEGSVKSKEEGSLKIKRIKE